MILAVYTLIHVAISLVGIGTGLAVLAGFLKNQRLDRWTSIFLATTVATSVTGFGFPFVHLLPSHVVGVVSLVVLAPTIYARYVRRLAANWRWIYVVGAVIALYLNVFVLVVQLFLKVPPLHALAPTQTEAPFAVAQGLVLLAFVVLGVFAVRRFKPATNDLPTLTRPTTAVRA
jgi:hypothetical protein